MNFIEHFIVECKTRRHKLFMLNT